MKKNFVLANKVSATRALLLGLVLSFGLSLGTTKAQDPSRPYRNIVTFTTEKEIGDTFEVGGDFGLLGMELNVIGAERVAETDTTSFFPSYNYKVLEKEITFDGDFSVFVCRNALISKIDLSQAPTLESLELDRNLLTELDVTECKKLYSFLCYENNIQGEAMTNLMKSLPPATPGLEDAYKSIIAVFNSRGDRFENNVCRDTDVQIALDKKWKVYDTNGSFVPSGWTPYAGVTTGISAIALKPIEFSQEPGRLTVTLENPGFVVLFNVKGEICARVQSDANGIAVFNTQNLPQGTYMLRAKGQSQKVLVR